jgi:hypothetical protein
MAHADSVRKTFIWCGEGKWVEGSAVRWSPIEHKTTTFSLPKSFEASRSDTQSDSAGCFSDAEGNETDCSSVSGDDINDNLDEVEDVGAWLINEEEHPLEHLSEHATLRKSASH